MTKIMKPLCIFHGGCDDGVASTWAIRHLLGDDAVEFYPGVYQQEPPDVTNRDVILVDFSYKRPVIEQMIGKARSLLILDHHKTAAADLAGLPPAGMTVGEWATKLHPRAPSDTTTNLMLHVGVLFDMNRSGAGIAWDFLSNYAERPEFIDYIEDRDLWRKKLPGGDEFTIALRSYPQDLAVWDRLISGGVNKLIASGHDIQRFYRQRIEEMAKSAYESTITVLNSQTDAVVYEARCWIANAPYFAASELAGELAERDGAQFGACYFEVRPGAWQYSLRSRGDFDVSAVAVLFGGGGHAGAAGFTVPKPIHVAVQPLTTTSNSP